MKILFIQTGGTIDKDYTKSTKGYAFEIGEPAVRRILEKINPTFEYEILPLIKKDSLDLNDEDREKLFIVCQKSDVNNIIITHGTDTMIATAKFLSKIKDKVIIITGATKPEKFSDSDAEFNLGSAIGAMNNINPGIYISMKGMLYKYDEVKRDETSGKFF